MKVLGFSRDYHTHLGPRIQLQQLSSMSAQICASSSNLQPSTREAAQDVLESSNLILLGLYGTIDFSLSFREK